ncbi:copper-binding protein [Piscinibacter sp. HJYY11]|uniref:copper-binding protein n=1 Tax=Piscinibacter sp. HJYY11 TaxID=2801333 RepID=UPI00191D730D|nr:copper-binding protein [Piscinibacter sp. HJYY11]MBL0726554.1 copper-binding protein [Piscinibacter sp. HJYY11]
MNNKLFLAAALLCAAPAWANPEWVAAEVVKLDPARSKITLKHAPIKSIKMAAMTMPFRVRDAALLAPLKVGDKVRFHVAEKDDELVIQEIEEVKR